MSFDFDDILDLSQEDARQLVKGHELEHAKQSETLQKMQTITAGPIESRHFYNRFKPNDEMIDDARSGRVRDDLKGLSQGDRDAVLLKEIEQSIGMMERKIRAFPRVMSGSMEIPERQIPDDHKLVFVGNIEPEAFSKYKDVVDECGLYSDANGLRFYSHPSPTQARDGQELEDKGYGGVYVMVPKGTNID